MAISYPRTFPVVRNADIVLKEAQSSVTMTQSPLNYAQEVQDHGGQIWVAEVTWSSLRHGNAMVLDAWLKSLKGMTGTFLMGPLVTCRPRGTWAGTPVVDGASQTGDELDIKGLSNGATILSGDYWQLGSGSAARIYQHVGDDILVGGDGLATLDLWPNLRASPSDEDPLTVVNPVGVWRLAQNKVGPEKTGSLYRISFRAVEDLD